MRIFTTSATRTGVRFGRQRARALQVLGGVALLATFGSTVDAAPESFTAGEALSASKLNQNLVALDSRVAAVETRTGERFERLRTSDDATATIVSQSGIWATAVHTAAGRTKITFIPGTFSSAPTCVCTSHYIIGSCTFVDFPPSATSVDIRNFRTDLSSEADVGFDLICMGPR